MAKVIDFPQQCGLGAERFVAVRTIGAGSGFVVRIMSQAGARNDLFVILDGTAEGSTAVAAVPSGEIEMAGVIAHAVLASLEAVETTRRIRANAF